MHAQSRHSYHPNSSHCSLCDSVEEFGTQVEVIVYDLLCGQLGKQRFFELFLQHEEQLMAERAGDEIHRIWLVSIRTVREVLGVLRVCVQTEKKYGFAMARDRTVFSPFR